MVADDAADAERLEEIARANKIREAKVLLAAAETLRCEADEARRDHFLLGSLGDAMLLQISFTAYWMSTRTAAKYFALADNALSLVVIAVSNTLSPSSTFHDRPSAEELPPYTGGEPHYLTF